MPHTSNSTHFSAIEQPLNSEFVHPRGTYQELSRPFSELQAEAKARRRSWLGRKRIRLFVPDDGPNGFRLPGGIGPGSFFEIEQVEEGKFDILRV